MCCEREIFRVAFQSEYCFVLFLLSIVLPLLRLLLQHLFYLLSMSSFSMTVLYHSVNPPFSTSTPTSTCHSRCTKPDTVQPTCSTSLPLFLLLLTWLPLLSLDKVWSAFPLASVAFALLHLPTSSAHVCAGFFLNITDGSWHVFNGPYGNK